MFIKYGLEFTGNCYACDLTQFRIEDGEIIISNVCEINKYSKYDILELIIKEKKLKLKRKNIT